jgi:DNA processing protein
MTEMPIEELRAWLRLSLSPGVGNEAARRLLQSFGSPEAVFKQSMDSLQAVVTPSQVQGLMQLPPDLAALLSTTQAWLAQSNERHLLTLADPDYPRPLLECSDPPLMLYMLAQHKAVAVAALNAAQRSLAMVGSRNPTAQGKGIAQAFAKDIAACGVHIVSGMALGVDGAAHEGALLARTPYNTGALQARTPQDPGALQADAANAAGAGITVAVVGTGLDRVYPRQHRELAHRIVQQGCIISEFPLGTPPLAQNFPKRNRIIAALSRATLVVEAAVQSGSLITARCALDMGKDVLAIPGSIHSPQSRGCHWLIKQGAKLVETAQDVLEELDLQAPPYATKTIAAYAINTRATGQFSSENELLDTEQAAAAEPALLQALGFAPTHLDALVERTGESAAKLQAQLMELELQGWVARLPGGLYQRQALT